jgi:hypothetical protein
MDGLERAVLEAQQQFEEQQRAAAIAAAQTESTARPGAGGRTLSKMSVKGSEEIARLKNEVKLLKSELKFHRQHPSAMAQQMLNQQAQMFPDHARSVSSGGKSPARSAIASLLRHQSTSAVEQLHFREQMVHDNMQAQQSPQQIVVPPPTAQPNEQRWVHRLKELERRLKAEREARLLDRQGARQRLEEGRLENEELRAMLEREKLRYEHEEASGAGSEYNGEEQGN